MTSVFRDTQVPVTRPLFPIPGGNKNGNKADIRRRGDCGARRMRWSGKGSRHLTRHTKGQYSRPSLWRLCASRVGVCTQKKKLASREDTIEQSSQPYYAFYLVRVVTLSWDLHVQSDNEAIQLARQCLRRFAV